MARDHFFTLPGSTRNSLPEETNCGEVLNSGMVVAAPAKVASMLPRHPQGQMVAVATPLDTLDQPCAVLDAVTLSRMETTKGAWCSPSWIPRQC